MHDRRLARVIGLPQPSPRQHLYSQLLAGFPVQSLFQRLSLVNVPTEQIPDFRTEPRRWDRCTNNTVSPLITAPATQIATEVDSRLVARDPSSAFGEAIL